MAINLGSAFVDIVPSTGNLAKGIRKDVDGAMAQAGRSGGAQFSTSFTSTIGGALRSIGSAVATTIGTAAAAAGGILATSLAKGFSRVTTIEDATAALTVQLQDSAKAGDLLADVLEVVKGTPFALDQFASAAANMVAFGIEAEKIPSYLTAIGEASATRGSQAGEFASRLTTVFGQVAAQGQLSLADVWRISDAGVNALAILGNHFGKTRDEMRDMISKGAVPAGEALDALAEGIINGSDGINGATIALGGTMEALGETLSGSKANFASAISRFGANVITPFRDTLTAGFQAGIAVFDELGARIVPALESFTDSRGFKQFQAFIKDLPSQVGPFLDSLRRIGDEFRMLIGPMLGLAAALGSGVLSGLPLIGALIPRIHPLLGLFAGLVAVSPELQQALKGAAETIAPALSSALGALADVIVPLIDPLAKFIALIIEKLATPAIVIAANVLEELARGFIAFANAFRAGDGDITSSGFPGFMEQVAFYARKAVDWIVAQWPKVREVIGGVIDWMERNVVPIVEQVAEDVTRAFRTAVDWVRDNWPKIRETVSNVIDWFGEHVVPVVEQVVDALVDAFWTAVAWVEENWPKIRDAVADGIEWFRTEVVPRVSAVVEGIVNAFRAVVSWVEENWPKIRDTVAGVIDWFQTYVVPAIKAHVEPIIGFFQEVVDVVVKEWPRIQQTIENVVEAVMIVLGPLLAIFGAMAAVILEVLWPAISTLAGYFTGVFIQVIVEVAAVLSEILVGAAELVAAAFDFVVAAAQTLWNWLQYLWDRAVAAAEYLAGPFIAAFELVKLAVDAVSTAMAIVYGWFKSVWDRGIEVAGFFLATLEPALATIKSAFDFISTAISIVWAWFKSLWDRAKDVAGKLNGLTFGALAAALGVIVRVIERIIGLAERALEVLAELAGRVASGTARQIPGLPGIPNPIDIFFGGKLGGSAHGNIFTSPSVTAIAEGGRMEAVLPLERPHDMARILSDPRVAGPVMSALPGAQTIYADFYIGNEPIARMVEGRIHERDRAAAAGSRF